MLSPALNPGGDLLVNPRIKTFNIPGYFLYLLSIRGFTLLFTFRTEHWSLVLTWHLCSFSRASLTTVRWEDPAPPAYVPLPREDYFIRIGCDCQSFHHFNQAPFPGCFKGMWYPGLVLNPFQNQTCPVRHYHRCDVTLTLFQHHVLLCQLQPWVEVPPQPGEEFVNLKIGWLVSVLSSLNLSNCSETMWQFYCFYILFYTVNL